MRYTLAAGAALAVSLPLVLADNCATGSEEIMGNWYCQAVNTIQYNGFSGSGSYNKVTNMDSTSGACSSTPFGYSGSMAPLDEDLSFHIRGPAQLKSFAVYVPGTDASNATKKAKRNNSHHKHGHSHHHHHKHPKHHQAEERALGDMVTAVINGVTESWANTYSGATPAPNVANVVNNAASAVESVVAQATATPKKAPFVPVTGGDWVQTAYYDAESQTAQGVTFLNNNGGQGSGVFDYVFGNSLSYASSDGTSGASSPQVLADVTIPSNNEVIIMSDKSCSDGADCGYVRPGTVAYQGFAGASKIFFVEFSMPLDGDTGFNGDMPALWLLNGQIPRTLQYGSADCSCWQSGCGEFDLFEVLNSGSTRCKSTLHGNLQGGDSDYFDRPTGAPIKAAIVMNNEVATIKVLESSFDFSNPSMTDSTVSSLSDASDDATNNLLSLFQLSA